MIHDLSERIRLVRLGKIRLGVKALAKNGQTYPAEVDYFVVPPEVRRVYGPKPKALDIMFPVEDRELIFPQAYKWYGQGKGLKCVGDLTVAMRLSETGVFVEHPCPCPLKDKECFKRAHLMVILPKISYGGVYQIDTGAYNSIVDVNSGLLMVKSMIGRISMVPLLLTRAPRVTFGGGTRRVHYTLQVSLNTNDTQWINRLRSQSVEILDPPKEIPPPVDENPSEDEEGVIVPEEELPVPAAPASSAQPPQARANGGKATERQVALLRKLASEKNVQVPDPSSLSRDEASAAIARLMAVAPPPRQKPSAISATGEEVEFGY